MKTITIDAGHYGDYNRSPVVPEYWESRRMWVLSGFLADALCKRGFKVKRTRNDEEKDVPIVERGKMAIGSDLFLSLHSNAVGKGGSERTNHVSVYGAYDDLNNSSELAGRLASAIAELMGVSAGYFKTRKSNSGDWEYYGVLRGARSVGCPLFYIVEHSFHTNRYASEWLLDDGNLMKLAETEAAVISGFFNASSVMGDVNANGILDAADVSIIKRAVLGTLKLTEEQRLLADVDGDGDIDIVDYSIAKRAYLEA